MGERTPTLDPRLVRYNQLLTKYASGGGISDFWVGYPGRMRFRIGSSPREFRVPYGFTLAVEELVIRAVADLAALLGQRARMEAGARQTLRGRELTLEVDVTEVREASERVTVRPRSFALRTFKAGSVEERTAKACLGSDPWLDTGVLDVWFFRGGAGSELAGILKELYKKALEQELREGAVGQAEPLTYLTHLALLQLFRSKMELLKQADSRTLSYEALDRAVAQVIASVLRASAVAVVTDLEMRGVPRDLTPVELATSLSSTPLLLMNSARTVSGTVDLNPVLRATPNAYGLTRELVAQLDEAYAVVGDDAPDVVGKLDALCRYVQDDAELTGSVCDVAEMIRLRSRVLGYLRQYDSPQDLRNLSLSDAVMRHATLPSLARDSDATGKALEAATQLLRGADDEPSAYLSELADVFRRLNKKGSSRRTGPVDIEALVRRGLERFLLLRLDGMVDHHASGALQFLVDRGSEWNDQEFVDQYEAGRVYRIATDVRPMRRERVERLEAHLFLDMKGFTKRTAVDRALNVADFMKEHFFAPILQRAHRYRDSDGRPRLRLNNLLGDAVTFSGDIVSLTLLADDLERIFEEYERKLSARDVGGAEDEARQELQAEYRAMHSLLTRARGELEQQLKAAQAAEGNGAHPTELKAQLDEVKRRIQQVDAYYEERRARLESSRIEVGLFVAYGPAAEVVHLEDPVYGMQNIAVAEKINEAARGTARNEAVRSKTELLLHQVNEERPEAILPFHVYVDRAFRLVLPEDLSASLDRSLAGSADPSAMAELVARRLEAEITQSPTEGGAQRLLRPSNDIYNVGRAFSQEAVEAFLRETAATRVAFRQRFAVTQFPAEIQQQFVFKHDFVDLVVSLGLAGAQKTAPVVFRFAGELTFRGFEASHSTSIYEMLKPSGAFYKQLLRYYLEPWTKGLSDGRVQPITGF